MFLNKSRCYNGGNQHKFSPRYDEIPNTTNMRTKGNILPEELRTLIYYKKYLFDICEWYGKVVIIQSK